ncbi:MAG: hypothetical protein JW748_03770 [Anaerolineales bacterium]|nr:hypothetical protein [Anaerolineales bacterium]
MKKPILPQHFLFWLSALLAAAGALGLAFLPWETVGAPVLMILLAGGLALGLALLDSPAEERRFVVRLFFVALGVRLAAAALFYWSTGGNEEYIYKDASTYDRLAWTLARAWHNPAAGAAGVGPADFLLDDLYPRLLAGLYFLIGHATAAAVVINIVLGASSVYLAYRIAAMLFGPVTARWTGWLTAFYTGFWLWEMMTLKDALFLFLLLLFFLGLYRLWNFLSLPDKSTASIIRAVGWTAVLIVVFLTARELRNYIPIILAGTAALIPMVEILKSGRAWRWALVIGSAVLLLMVFWPVISRRGLAPVTLESQSTLFKITELPDTRTVGVFLNWIIAHPLGFLRYLALSMFSTALAPYAWLLPGTLPEVPRFESYMIAFPGMWLWYFLLPFSIFGIREAVRRSRGGVWPMLFYAAAVFLVVSVFIPREYRHRDMIMPIALMMAAEGLAFSRRWWVVGLLVWIPLIGFIAWKLNSAAPVLLALGAGVAAVVVWHIRVRRRREDQMMRLG